MNVIVVLTLRERLSDYERERYRDPIRDALKALLALGWTIEYADHESGNTNRNSMRRDSGVIHRFLLPL